MRLVVKIGSNVLTRPDGSLDVTRLSAITDQVADLCRAGNKVVMVSSGAVASGRSELRKMPAADIDSVSQRQLYSAVGQAKLINRYYELFRDHDMHCAQVLATKESFSNSEHYANMSNALETMLAAGVIPIVNENDTVSIDELMFTDNDELSGLIATIIHADALIILSNIDGLYTGAPDAEGSELISTVAVGDDPSVYICHTRSSAGRGGMESKCKVARQIAAAGIPVTIANGKRENILPLICAGDGNTPCTRFTTL